MKNFNFKRFILAVILFILPTSIVAGGHYTYNGPDISGAKVKIFGPWLAPEDESFRDVLSIFEKATGASVEYGGSDEFEQIINIDCKAGNPADIAVFPQPGLAANIAATGCLAPQGNDLKQMVLDADYPIHNIVYKEFRHKQRFGADGDHWSTLIHIEIAKLAEQKIQPLITSL